MAATDNAGIKTTGVLPPQIYQLLEDRCKEQGITKSQYIRLVVTESLGVETVETDAQLTVNYGREDIVKRLDTIITLMENS
jgi:hypothetical protein